MANLLQRAVQRSKFPAITFDQWTSSFDFGGLNYPYSFSQTQSGHQEDPDWSFESFVQSAYKSNGAVFACMLARQLAFSEARFTFRQRLRGRPGDLFGTAELALLERPWPGGVTADLLSRAIQDVDMGGNFYAVKRPGRIKRMRPDWVTILLGSFSDPNIQAGDVDAEVVGYLYHPGGRGSDRDPQVYTREEVAHYAPIPDPSASYRGMSWLIPVIREFMSDTAMMVHKQKFFDNGATPNMVVTMDPSIKKADFPEWIKMFSDKHEGALNAYKTLYLGAGAVVTPVGKDFRQMDFAVTQAAGETRIAAAAGIPPVIVGLSEGLKAATYSNYSQARRRFADMTLRPLWRSMANSLEVLVNVPSGSELWYDDRDIPFLVEDFKDRAEVLGKNSQAIRQLVDAGFTPASVIDAITATDLTRLQHTGLFSVQLWEPGQSPTQGGAGAAHPGGADQTPQVKAPTTPKEPASPKTTGSGTKSKRALPAEALSLQRAAGAPIVVDRDVVVVRDGSHDLALVLDDEGIVRNIHEGSE